MLTILVKNALPNDNLYNLYERFLQHYQSLTVPPIFVSVVLVKSIKAMYVKEISIDKLAG